MSIERVAPPVQDRVVEIGQSNGYSTQELERGRRIYLTDCARCHTVEPVSRYSLTQWEKTLPEMAKEARLNPEERRAVRAYILTAHQAAASVNRE